MEDKKVLCWADFDKRCLKHLIKATQALCPGYSFEILDNIELLSDSNFNFDAYDVIVLQSTDVTKFSAFPTERENIQENLLDFVDNGKKLIISHDVIYRRTRNEILQKIFNYQINNFYREKTTTYYKTSYCKKTHAFSDLEAHFELNDGEICWGDLTKISDKKVFFDTVCHVNGKRLLIPLVFGKVYGEGQLLFFNTGDTYEEPPQPINDLDSNFVKILAECINIDLKQLKDDDTRGDKYLPHLHECDFSKPFSFISYSSKNSARVYEICYILDKLGINYYLDKKNITSSTPDSDGWKEEVCKALNHKNCKAGFCFISEDYLNSSHCFNEIEIMNNFNNDFTPIMLSISLAATRIVDLINTWSSLDDANRIEVFKNILSISKDPITQNLEIKTLVFECHRDCRQFYDIQLLNSIGKNCDCSDILNSLSKEKICEIIADAKKIIE